MLKILNGNVAYQIFLRRKCYLRVFSADTWLYIAENIYVTQMIRFTADAY